MKPSWFDAFCYYGYLPKEDDELLGGIREGIEKNNNQNTRPHTVSAAKEIWSQSIKRSLERTSADKYVVPLSGGLDSRMVLGGLLDEVPKENITTVTVGCKGMLDYKIAQQISKHIGIDNKIIDLHPKRVRWSSDEFVPCLRGLSRPIRTFDRYAMWRVLQKFDDATIWSGFMGGELAGSHLPNQTASTWKNAQNNFASWSSFAPSLTADNFDPISVLPNEPFTNPELLSFKEQIDFSTRQRAFISNVIFRNDNSVVTPFMNPNWVSFMLSVPNEKRQQKKFYRSILQDMYPDLFQFPTTSNYGCSLSVNKYLAQVIWKMKLLKRSILLKMGRYIPKPSRSQFDLSYPLRNRWEVASFIRGMHESLEQRGIISQSTIDDIWRPDNIHYPKLKILAYTELYLRSKT